MGDEDREAEELLGQMVTDADEDDGNGPESDEHSTDGQEDQTGAEDGSEGQRGTFPRKYVEELRRESQGYRERAKKGETALSRLTDSVMREATNKILIDPSDLEYDEETMSDEDGFPDPEKIKDAATKLIEKKPHLAYRRPKGDIGQGHRSKDEDFSLADILRNRAG